MQTFKTYPRRLYVPLAYLTLSVGFASPAFTQEKTIDKAATEAKKLMYQIVDKSDYTVNFKKGSSAVDQSSANSIKALLESLKDQLTGATIVVGAWSDRDFPLDQKVKLSAADGKLASSRADAVANYIKKLGVTTDVEKVNFAEQNTLFSKFFSLGSDAPEIKDAIQNGVSDSQKVAAVAKTMRDQGGAGKAVIVVRKEVTPVR